MTDHDAMVANILRAWHEANAECHARGAVWYSVAHDLAAVIGNGNVTIGAGILAAVSPRTPWERNVTVAERCARGDLAGTMGGSLDKVRRIVAGEHPLEVLPADLKTGHFFRNIADPYDPDPVTIDRHAWSVAVGQYDGTAARQLGKPEVYARVAHAYREAARRLGALPNVVQAVTWCAARKTGE